jgi:hypothetical protein
MASYPPQPINAAPSSPRADPERQLPGTAPPLWVQLDPARQTQIAQLLATLIQRLRLQHSAKEGVDHD